VTRWPVKNNKEFRSVFEQAILVQSGKHDPNISYAVILPAGEHILKSTTKKGSCVVVEVSD
jgi:hypothetical protein